MLVSGVPALVMCLILEKVGGLRASEQAEIVGLDVDQWGVSNFGDDLEAATAVAEPSIPVPAAAKDDQRPVGGLSV
jgi:ammonium transporter, Amt family